MRFYPNPHQWFVIWVTTGVALAFALDLPDIAPRLGNFDAAGQWGFPGQLFAMSHYNHHLYEKIAGAIAIVGGLLTWQLSQSPSLQKPTRRFQIGRRVFFGALLLWGVFFACGVARNAIRAGWLGPSVDDFMNERSSGATKPVVPSVDDFMNEHNRATKPAVPSSDKSIQDHHETPATQWEPLEERRMTHEEIRKLNSKSTSPPATPSNKP